MIVFQYQIHYSYIIYYAEIQYINYSVAFNEKEWINFLKKSNIDYTLIFCNLL